MPTPENPVQEPNKVHLEGQFGKPLSIEFFPGAEGTRDPYYMVKTSRGEIRMPVNEPILQELARDAAETSIREDNTILPARIGARFMDMLKERGIPFKGDMNDAWEGLNAILDKMVEAQSKITRIKAQAAAQKMLDAIGENISIPDKQWGRLNPVLRTNIAIFAQAITVFALEQGGVSESTVATAGHVAEIHNQLQNRTSAAEKLLGRTAQALSSGIGSAADGIGGAVGSLAEGAKKTITDVPKALGTGVGKGVGGLLGGAIGEFNKTKDGKDE